MESEGDILDQECIVCRCEEVRLIDIEKAFKNGVSTSRDIKMATRAGMGICQGRICRSILEDIIEETQEGLQPNSSKLTTHNPARPVALSIVRKGM